VTSLIINSYIEHELSDSKNKAKENRLEREQNPWALRYRCSALLTELSSHLGAGHIVST